MDSWLLLVLGIGTQDSRTKNSELRTRDWRLRTTNEGWAAYISALTQGLGVVSGRIKEHRESKIGDGGVPGPRIIALLLGTPGQGSSYLRDVGPRDVGAIKDIQRLAPMAQPGRSDYPVASGPVR